MATVRYVCGRFGVQSVVRVAWTMSLWLQLSPALAPAQEPRQKRPATVEDAIRMVRIAGHLSNLSYAGSLTEDFAYFSPDRKQFVVILKKGNLEKNTNDYQLLLFQTNEVFSSPTPRTLTTMCSSSNREAITDVAWLADNATILFRGENPGETSQLYSVNSKSGELRKLTYHPTSIVAFSSDTKGQTIAYAAEKPAQPVLTEAARREGVIVAREDMTELLIGERTGDSRELFILDTSRGTVRPLPIGPEWKGKLYGSFLNLALSPDGNHLVVSVNLTEVPERWHEYREPTLSKVIASVLPSNALSWVFRYLIIDTATGSARSLFDGPLSFHGTQVVWGNDSRSLILTGVFLPIDRAAANPRALSVPATVVVDTDSLQFTELTREESQFARQEGSLFVFEARLPGSKPHSGLRYFRQEGKNWVPAKEPLKQQRSISVTARQDLNTPPVIAVSDGSGRTATLLDPNPEFREMAFGAVQEIKFLGAMRKEVRAGLYFPVGHVPGKKYPLIVQTHGFDPKSFWIEGSFTTAFAAQALAGRGFLVLQVPDTHAGEGTPDEAPNMAKTLERAVEFVDQMGILDRDRIGLIGFSRTGLYVHYLLTHSRMRFAAAVIADGSDGGYSQYLQFLNGREFTAADSEAINGAMPFGTGLLYWLRRSPEFSLDLVHTPVLFQVSSPQILPTVWAPFVALRRLSKPVELLYFPAGSHIMEKPWDRLASQGSSVDWFAFWLKDEEDSDPAKAGEYQRWRSLHALLVRGETAGN
jgi:dipeptidyl aminopeptidase/acylaminoacyl peptidase